MNRSATLATLAVAFLTCSRSAAAPAVVAKVRVSAGDHVRQGAVVSFVMPAGVTNSSMLRLISDEPPGKRPRAMVQVDGDGRGSFLLPSLAKGQTATFELFSPVPAPQLGLPLTIRKTNHTVEFWNTGRRVFTYQAEPGELPRPDIKPVFTRGGYLHPIYSPAGRLVSDDFPVNHVHHHGIWAPWTKTEFEGRAPDFWNMGEGKGRVEFVALDGTWNGPVHAGLRSRHQFVDMLANPEKVALNESWDVRLLNTGSAAAHPYFVFDLTITQSCATSSPLKLPKYHYGGLGFRGNGAWNGKANCSFLTSEGVTDRIKGNETRGRWCWIGGDVDGARAGVTILCHPENFRAPQPMRLHPDEPFFCFAPSQLGDWSIEPGKPYVARYRIAVMDGAPDSELIEQLWRDYAEPPKVELLP